MLYIDMCDSYVVRTFCMYIECWKRMKQFIIPRYSKYIIATSPTWPSQPPVPSGAPCYGGPDDVLCFQGIHLKTARWEALQLRTSAMVFSNLSIYLSIGLSIVLMNVGVSVLNGYFLHLSKGTPPSLQYINQVSLGVPRQDVLLDVQSWYWPTGHHNLNIHELTWTHLQIPNNPQKHQLQYPSWIPFPVLPSNHFGWAFTLRPPGNLIKGLLKRTLGWDGCIPWFQSAARNGYRQTPIYLYHLISTFLPVNLWPFIRTYDAIVACRLRRCLHHGIHFQACEHVLLGDLGWALDSRYWYNVIHMSN